MSTHCVDKNGIEIKIGDRVSVLSENVNPYYTFIIEDFGDFIGYKNSYGNRVLISNKLDQIIIRDMESEPEYFI